MIVGLELLDNSTMDIVELRELRHAIDIAPEKFVDNPERRSR